MKLFENGVGRPSNEVLRKRKIVTLSIVTSVIAFVAILIGGITLLVSKSNNVDNLKGSANKANVVVLASQKKNIFSIFGDLFKPKKTTTSPIKTTSRTKPTTTTTKKGNTTNIVTNANNSLALSLAKTDSISVKWNSKKGIKDIRIYEADSNFKKIGKEMLKVNISKNKKSGAYTFESNGKKLKIKSSSYYVITANFSEGLFKKSVLNLKVKTPSVISDMSSVIDDIVDNLKNIGVVQIKNVEADSFVIKWNSPEKKCITNFTVYHSDASKKIGQKIGTKYPTACDGAALIGGDGSTWQNEIEPKSYYVVSVKFSNGDVINRHLITKEPQNEKKFKVVYIANNGTDDMKTQLIDYNVATQLDKNTFKFGSKKFMGWIAQARVDGALHSLVLDNNNSVWKRNANGAKLSVLKDNSRFSYSDKKVKTIYMIAKWSNDTDKFIVNSYARCNVITAPRDTKYWRIATFYKEQSSGSFGSNKIENLNENHYADGEETRIICFDKQKYDNETYRLMVKKTTERNDIVSGSVSSWKPSGWNENSSIGWAYKDFDISW